VNIYIGTDDENDYDDGADDVHDILQHDQSLSGMNDVKFGKTEC
jgi:hypothetical protein